MPIAFFDLDKTLIARNSGKLWIRSELRQGYLSKLQFLRATGWFVKYSLGLADMEQALRLAISSLAGDREVDVHRRTVEFYQRECLSLIRPGALDVIEEHRLAGDALVLLTSSSNYLSAEFARDLNFDEVLCNRFEVDDEGLFTGRPVEPLCFGTGKLAYARRCAETRGVDLGDCAFYTDSLADISVLEVVGKPVVVDPDPRLRRRAKANGWPIADWDQRRA
jgi:HAD superfamily hydrolase (TIGR01490 family)